MYCTVETGVTIGLADVQMLLLHRTGSKMRLFNEQAHRAVESKVKDITKQPEAVGEGRDCRGLENEPWA